MRDSIKIIISIIFLFLTACSSSSNYESAGEYLDSSTTTAKVKANLVDGLGRSGFSITVNTFKDVVQLGGFVDNTRIKQRAARIAAHVPGVKSVRNGIVVKAKA